MKTESARNPVRVNVSWLMLGHGVSKPLWLGFSLYLCPLLLDEQQYGVYAASFSLASLCAIVANWGFSSYAVREVARARERAETVFSNFFGLALGLHVFAIGLALSYGLLQDYGGRRMGAVGLAALYMAGLSLVTFTRSFFHAFERMEFEARSVVLEKCMVIILGAAALFCQGSAVAVLGAMALGMVLTGGATLRWLGQFISVRWTRLARIDEAFLREALPSVFMLGIAGQFVVMYSHTDTVMLDAIQGETVAAAYGLAYRLTEAPMLVSSLLIVSVYPRLSDLYERADKKGFVRLASKSAVLLLLFGLALALFMWFASDLLVDLMYGETEYQRTPGAIRWLAPGIPFMCVGGLLVIVLSAQNDQAVLALCLGIGAAFNVVLNLILIPEFSEIGASMTTTLTQALAVLLLLGRATWILRRDSIDAS